MSAAPLTTALIRVATPVGVALWLFLSGDWKAGLAVTPILVYLPYSFVAARMGWPTGQGLLDRFDGVTPFPLAPDL